MFPALVNCTTIDWFLPWPNQALKSVAEHFLKTCDLPNFEGIIDTCVDMQQWVRMLTEWYLAELWWYYYVTPTSYLQLITSFKNLLAKKEEETEKTIWKFDRGLKQLDNASKTVGQLKIDLQELEPKLE